MRLPKLTSPKNTLELMTGAAAEPLMSSPPSSTLLRLRMRKVPLLMFDTVLMAKTSAVTPAPTEVALVMLITLDVVEPAKVLVSGAIGTAVTKPTTGS